MNTEWETPDYIFEPLQKEFDLDLDVCASHENAKLPNYFTKEDDGLVQHWGSHRVWCNPPYGRGLIEPWVRKAYRRPVYTLTVILLPAWTDRRWFHRYVWDGECPQSGIRVRLLEGRPRFLENGVPSKNTGTFGSMVVIFGA
ncbi:hypothetical protein LCGC14_0712820 [marine sediment metagenome]|uniref:DNA N-6-adenine-methyltransferase (Dam) n=1 Tax=marine sediment metagenome TaxID=412755 RepID=A0A0F9QZY9_9ZZZZ